MASSTQRKEDDGVRLFKLLLAHFRGEPELYNLIKFYGCEDSIRCEEVGDGNLNYVYTVFCADDPSRRVILKHAPPYIKILGPQFPLSGYRLNVEFKAMRVFHRLARGSVPEPYVYDEQNNSLCMEYLDGYVDLRKEMIAGKFDLAVAQKLGEFMAAVHGGTHVSGLKTEEFQQLSKDFQNTGQCELTEQFVFTRPFTPGDETNKIPEPIIDLLPLVYGDQKILSAVKAMKSLFKEKKECLVHGDLHTGSVMVNGELARVMDVEFAYVGPAALDVGMLIAHYLMSHFCHMSTENDGAEHRHFAYKLVEACKATVNSYLTNLSNLKHFVDVTKRETLLSEVAGMAGCEILRRIIGAAQLEDFSAPKVSPLAMADAFQAGVRLLSSYRTIKDVNRLIVVALQLV